MENQQLRARLEEAEEMLRAIGRGEVDALVIEKGAGPKVYTIEGQEAETNRFRSAILAQVSDAVIAVDGEERVIYLNAAAERLYGFSTSSALGRPLTDVRALRWPHPEGQAAAEATFRARGEWHGEYIHILNDGREVNIESSITALRDSHGHAGGRLKVMRDVTERNKHQKQVLSSEIRYRRLFEAAHDGILILDPGTRKIVDANPLMTRMLGYSLGQLIGKELFEIGLLKDEAASQEMFRELKRSHHVRYENLPLEAQTGRHQDVEVPSGFYPKPGLDN